MISGEGCTKGDLERTVRPFDMHCPEMSLGRSTGPNYWKSQCVKRQRDKICKRCKAGRKYLEETDRLNPAPKPAPKPAEPKPKPATPKPAPKQVRRCSRADCKSKHYANDLCKVHHAMMKNDRRKAEAWRDQPEKPVSYRLTFEARDRQLLAAILAESQRNERGFHETMLAILRRGVRS
jgi:hypothetical protein